MEQQPQQLELNDVKSGDEKETKTLSLSSFYKGPTSVLEHAQHALAVIHKQTLTSEEQDQIIGETVRYWNSNVNSGFLKYRKSVADEYTSVEWREPVPGGVIFEDVKGRQYIDCLGGFGIYNCGHRHPVVVAAVQAQMMKQALHSQELLDPLRTYCAHLLSMITPGNLDMHFFTNSGTESVEACLKMAMLATGRKHHIAAINAFHGKTLGSLSVTSKSAFRQPFLPLLNVTHVPLNDLHVLRTTFESNKFTGNLIASVILEPIQGEGGMYVCSNEYMQEARKLCDEYGACLILDEVQTGMGRTGKWFACEHAGVVPDIMAIGKAFGGGIMPAGACVAKPKIWEKYVDNPFIMTTTFGGNPLAMAAAIATINVILTENLIENAVTRGHRLRSGLEKMMDQFPQLIRDIRGRGLMLGIEFITNDIGIAFSRMMFARCVLVSGTLVNAVVVRIEPPLTITEQQVDLVLSTAKECLTIINHDLNPKHIKSKL